MGIVQWGHARYQLVWSFWIFRNWTLDTKTWNHPLFVHIFMYRFWFNWILVLYSNWTNFYLWPSLLYVMPSNIKCMCVCEAMSVGCLLRMVYWTIMACTHVSLFYYDYSYYYGFNVCKLFKKIDISWTTDWTNESWGIVWTLKSRRCFFCGRFLQVAGAQTESVFLLKV